MIKEAEQPLPIRRVALYLYRHEWRQAGEAAYEAVETGTLEPYDEPSAEAAIRLHARDRQLSARRSDFRQPIRSDLG